MKYIKCAKCKNYVPNVMTATCCDCDSICNYEEKLPTNADHIRSMSDDELAKMLWEIGRNYRAVCADPVVDYNEHRDGLIAWLKQPAKGE